LGLVASPNLECSSRQDLPFGAGLAHDPSVLPLG
jgi:hypothetical protein